MGYPVEADAPKITVGPLTIAVGAFDWSYPFGTLWECGTYQLMPDGTWNELFRAEQTTEDGSSILLEVQKAGGINNYMTALEAKMNAELAQVPVPNAIPTPPVVPTGEPTTDAEARGMIAHLLSLKKIVLANGKFALQ